MNPDKAEDDFDALLAAYDDALAKGVTPPVDSVNQVPAELRPRLKAAVEWCRMVRRLLPATGSLSSVESITPSVIPPLNNEVGKTPIPDSQALSASPEALSQLGRFQIRRELGRGGMSVVFLAYDPKLGREVALKIPRPEAIILPELRSRFQQEARAAAMLDHPNIVPVYEAGEEQGICYIASAYCPGVTLGAWLRERTEPVAFDLAARLVATLAEAVEHAHRRGILHRDLKPANVLLVSGGVVSGEWSGDIARDHSPLTTHHSPFIPKITDFGLAKLVDGEADLTRAEHPTRSGAIVGTPAYMAPEQAAGQSHAVGPAADVYAMGVLLYEILTGRPPFRADTISETLHLVRSEEPLAPAKLRPRMPRDLETICLKCLDKDPRKRYASAGELAADLERFLAHKPITARRASWWERGIKWVRRRPALSALLGVSGAAVLTVTMILVVANMRLRQQRDAADAARRDALAGYRKAREAVDQMLRRIGIDVLVYVPQTELLQRELVDDALKFYETLAVDRSDDPDSREELGFVYLSIGAMQATRDHKPEAEAAYRQALAIHRALLAEFPHDVRYPHDVAIGEQNLGRILGFAPVRPGARQESEQLLIQARDTLAELAADYPHRPKIREHLATTCGSIGDLMQSSGRRPEAEEGYRQCITLFEKLMNEFPTDLDIVWRLATNYHAMGTMFASASQLAKAESAWRRAVELSDRLAAAQPSVPAYRRGPSPLLLHNLGMLLRNKGSYGEAEKMLTRAAEYREKLVSDFPSDPKYRLNLARTLQYLAGVRLRHVQRRPLARQTVERAIGYLLPISQADPKNTVWRQWLREDYAILAETLIALGEHRDAAVREDFQKLVSEMSASP